ncbi:V-set domain-containing T-cell activation inhibitor 1-like [Trachinotus anak]|uniref:V-set domain-containing T-cell activation inhibitor 1-like n=1 Tax=Trachinotus anak TaxID=443729 RepID=UPI0039F1BAEC
MDALKSSAGMCVWVMLAFAAQTVSCQLKVQGFVGEDVLLPCNYPGVNLLPEKLNITWRNQGDHVVLGFDGVQNITAQHQKFRGRVASFPDLYRQGNFSIVLRNVQQVDSGVYECHMVVDFRQRVHLGVSGKPGEATTPEASRGEGFAPTSLHLALLSAPLLLLL